MRLVLGGGRVAEHAGEQARAGVDDRHGRDLAAGEHEVAEAHLLVDERAHALVEALVAAADERDAIARASASAARWRRARPAGRAARGARGRLGRVLAGRRLGVERLQAVDEQSTRITMPVPPP